MNASKYVKLSTQPWSGNGIKQPITSLTFQDKTPGSVELSVSPETSTLLSNGQPITAGSGVLSVTSNSSNLTLSSNTGDIIIGSSFVGGGVTSISPGQNVTTSGTDEILISVNSNTFLTNIITSGQGFQITGSTVKTLTTSTNLGQAVAYADYQIDLSQGTANASGSIVGQPPGFYLFEIEFGDTDKKQWNQSYLGRYSGGLLTISGAMDITQPEFTTLIVPRVSIDNFNFPGVQGLFESSISLFQTGTIFDSNSRVTLNVFRVI
jgi:hypothetical protein